jgi:Holliday junction resolvasome RuvABC endonuclease subunit
MSRGPDLVLAIHPTSRAFGWVVFEGPLAPIDWGIANAKKNHSARCMVKFEKLLNQYQPRAVVFEKFEGAVRSDRQRLLAKTMIGFAANRDMETLIYSRADVGTAIVRKEAATRHAIASAVADLLPILRDRLPPARKLWQPEDGRQCLFDAAALGITHYVVTQRDV